MKLICILLLFFFNFCTSEQAYEPLPEQYSYYSTASGRAAEVGTRSMNSPGKKATCCMAAELNAQAYSSDSKVIFQGKVSSAKVFYMSSGVVTKPKRTECISTLNHFEECQIKVFHETTDIPFKKRGTGWVDNDTYIVNSVGKASANAIEKQSYAMKQTTCVEASKLNAIQSMISDLSKDKNRHYSLSFSSPQIWLDACESVENDYETCKCQIMLFQKGLKQTITDLLQ